MNFVLSEFRRIVILRRLGIALEFYLLTISVLPAPLQKILLWQMPLKKHFVSIYSKQTKKKNEILMLH